MACQEIISGRLALATYPLGIPFTRLLASGETSNWALRSSDSKSFFSSTRSLLLAAPPEKWAELSRYGSFYNASSGISEGSAEGRALDTGINLQMPILS